MNAERTSVPASSGVPSLDREVMVLVKGDQRSYELRERIKAVGLHWLKGPHAWSGAVPECIVPQMQAEGLQVVPLVPEGHPLDRFAEREVAAPTQTPKTPAKKTRQVRPNRKPAKEAPVRLTDNQRASAFLPEHNWDLRDITANLSDDDRAEDERRVEQYLRDLRARVKATRAIISADPEIAHTLATNPTKAAMFYAVHHVTERQVRAGVPDLDVQGMDWENLVDVLGGNFKAETTSIDRATEETERANAVLPGPEVLA